MKRTLLFPLSLLYRGIVGLRNWCYDQGYFSASDAAVPVYSVGNINVGGTGKTPVIRYIYERFAEEGYEAAVLTRGYRRSEKDEVVLTKDTRADLAVEMVGDEPWMLTETLRKPRIVVNTDRITGAVTATERWDIRVLLLDDGFQYRQLRRVVDIVVVPVDDVLNDEQVLPGGRLREPWSALNRATHILLMSDSTDVAWDEATTRIRKYTQAPVFRVRKTTSPCLMNPEQEIRIALRDPDAPVSVIAVAGIGNPGSFFRNLAAMSVDLTDHRIYHDHYPYPESEQRRILEWYRQSGADALVMTAKDYYKFDHTYRRKYPIYFLPVHLMFDERFYQRILGELPR